MSVSKRKALIVWEQLIDLHNGNYSRDVPLKSRPPSLLDNKAVADHRLRLLGRKLNKDLALKIKHSSSTKELMDKGYAKELPPDQVQQADGAVWYTTLYFIPTNQISSELYLIVLPRSREFPSVIQSIKVPI